MGKIKEVHENEDQQYDIVAGPSTSKVVTDDGTSAFSEATCDWAILAKELKTNVNMSSWIKEELPDSDDEVEFLGFSPTFQCLPNIPSFMSLLPHYDPLMSPTYVQRTPSPASSVPPNSSHSTSRVPSPSISLPSTPHLSRSPSHSPSRPNPPSPSCPSSAFHASIPPPHSPPFFPVRPPSSPPSQPPSPAPSRPYTPDNEGDMVKIKKEPTEIKQEIDDNHEQRAEIEQVDILEENCTASTSKSPKSKKSRNRELDGLCDALTQYFIPNSLDTSVRNSCVKDDKSKSPTIIIDKYNKNMKRKSLPSINETSKKEKQTRKSIDSTISLKKRKLKKNVHSPQKNKSGRNASVDSKDNNKKSGNKTNFPSDIMYELPTLPSEPYPSSHMLSHFPPWPTPFEENNEDSLEMDTSDEEIDERNSDDENLPTAIGLKRENLTSENFQSIYNDRPEPPNLIDIHMWGLLETPYLCNLLQSLNLIPKKKNCDSCGLEMSLTKRNLITVIDRLIWMCENNNCNETVGLRTGTIFERSKLSFTSILKMVHLFVSGISSENIIYETSTKEEEVLEWLAFFKETLIIHLMNNSESTGGPRHTVDVGDAPVHNSAALLVYGIQDAQLLCGLERETGKTFLLSYMKHFVKTEVGEDLLICDPPVDSMITQWINPGSTVITKGTEQYPILLDDSTYYHIDINRVKKPLKSQHWENICQNLPNMSLGFQTNGGDLATQAFLDSCRIRKESPFWNFLRAAGMLY
ncbi:unnamed protein product [Meganyctiphanes norvegica]|uniref:Uncharacterized protein n=1 Tax=Meganyctiphanes norvegica TaxID=48144 RepID=A0AAV2PQV8_MEGNR